MAMDVSKLQDKTNQLKDKKQNTEIRKQQAIDEQQKYIDKINKEIQEKFFDVIPKIKSEIISNIKNISDEQLQQIIEEKLTLDKKIELEFVLYLPLILYYFIKEVDMSVLHSWYEHQWEAYDEITEKIIGNFDEFKKTILSDSKNILIYDVGCEVSFYNEHTEDADIVFEFERWKKNIIFNISTLNNNTIREDYQTNKLTLDDDLYKLCVDNAFKDKKCYKEHKNITNNGHNYDYSCNYYLFDDIEKFKEDTLNALIERLEEFGFKIVDSEVCHNNNFDTIVYYRVNIKNPTVIS